MSTKKLYFRGDEHRVTRALLGSGMNKWKRSPSNLSSRLYPQRNLISNVKYANTIPEVGSSGPASLAVTPKVSYTEMELNLLKSKRGDTFAKIAKRNPEGWQKIIKAQLEHEKFLNSMHFYNNRALLISNRFGTPYSQDILQDRYPDKPKRDNNFKSFRIPWKTNTNKSTFVSPTEQKQNAFNSLQNECTEPPQTPPETKTSKTEGVGDEIVEEQNGTEPKKSKKNSDEEELSKPYVSIVEKPVSLRTKEVSVEKGMDNLSKNSKSLGKYSLYFKSTLPLGTSFDSGLLSKAKRPDQPEIRTSTFNLSNSDSQKSQFSTKSLQSPASSQKLQSSWDSQKSQPSNSQKILNSSYSKQSKLFSNPPEHSQSSRTSSNLPTNPQKSQILSESTVDSKDIYYLTNKLRNGSTNVQMEVRKESPTEILQEKDSNQSSINPLEEKPATSKSNSSSFSDVTTKLRKLRILQKSPFLPVFIPGPYYKRLGIVNNITERELKEEFQESVDEEFDEEQESI